VNFASKCEEISNQMELFGEWRNNDSKKARVDSNSTTLSVAATPKEDMMEWEPTIAVNTNITCPGKNRNGYPSKQPEDQALIGKRAKWVDKTKIDKQWKEKRCLRCGRDGCRVESCPLAAAKPPAGNNMPVARARVTEAAVEESGKQESLE
jgi:hypothetical protein